jgi:hypothetical protein
MHKATTEAVSKAEMVEAAFCFVGMEHKRKPRPGQYYRRAFCLLLSGVQYRISTCLLHSFWHAC